MRTVSAEVFWLIVSVLYGNFFVLLWDPHTTAYTTEIISKLCYPNSKGLPHQLCVCVFTTIFTSLYKEASIWGSH